LRQRLDRKKRAPIINRSLYKIEHSKLILSASRPAAEATRVFYTISIGAAAVSPPVAGFLSDLIGIPRYHHRRVHVNACHDSVRISSQGPMPHGFHLRPDLASGPTGAYELVINLKTVKA
jgi:hypothetical protein